VLVNESAYDLQIKCLRYVLLAIIYLQHPFISGKFINVKANDVAPSYPASERRSLERRYICMILTLILLQKRHVVT